MNYRRDAKGWPVKQDGTPYKMGELSRDEQRHQTRLACNKLQREFDDPGVKSKIEAVLNGTNVNN